MEENLEELEEKYLNKSISLIDIDKYNEDDFGIRDQFEQEDIINKEVTGYSIINNGKEYNLNWEKNNDVFINIAVNEDKNLDYIKTKVKIVSIDEM